MKTFLFGLISTVSLLMGSTAAADMIGEENDTYIGFQVTIPLDANHAGFMSSKNEYSAILINQADGIREGIAFTRDINGIQTIGYVRPSQTYKIDQSRISDYTIPIVNLNEGAGIRNSYSGGGVDIFYHVFRRCGWHSSSA